MSSRERSGEGRAPRQARDVPAAAAREARPELEASGAMPSALLDPAAVKGAGETALDFPADSPLAEDVREALARARASTLLEDLYDARGRLFRVSAALAAEREQACARIERRSEIFLRSVASARELAEMPHAPAGSAAGKGANALQKGGSDPYAAFLDKAKDELAHTRTNLDARSAQEKAFFAAEIARVSAAIADRVRALLEVHAPCAAFSVQPVGREHALAWLERPSPDDAVLLSFLLSGHLPTHYDALFDDALDDMALPPATFFAEEGFAARPGSQDEADALCHPQGRLFVPYKAMIPFRLPDRDFPRLRFVNQGPILQLVAREAAGDYEPLMPIATAEAVAGLLIRLQVEKRIALEFKAM